MRNLIVLISILTLWTADAAPKAKPVKKVPAKAQAKVAPKRRPSQATNYQCAVLYKFAKGPIETSVNLSMEAKFNGFESHEEITLKNVDGVKSISRNSYFESPARPYIIDTFRCDDYLNCSGERVTYTAKGPNPKQFAISPGGADVSASLGSQEIFYFKRQGQGFLFRSTDYMSTNKKYGIQITCTPN